MRIKHDSGDAARSDDTGKLREEQHGTFDMHMAIDKTGGKPTPLQVAFLAAMIDITGSADTNDEAVGESDIGGIAFTTTDIYQPGIAQHQVGWLLATRDLNAALKSVHKKFLREIFVRVYLRTISGHRTRNLVKSREGAGRRDQGGHTVARPHGHTVTRSHGHTVTWS